MPAAARLRIERYQQRLIGSRWLVGLSVALVLGFCAVAVVMLAQLRHDALSQAMTGADNLLAAVSQDVGRNVELYELSLEAVADGLQLPELAQLSPQLRNQVLFDRAATAEYLGSILVMDEQGDVVEDAGAIPARHDNFSDREYFRVHQAQAGIGLFVSAPFRRRLTGNGDWVIAFSRRLNHPDGSFAGVVSGTLRLDYFKDLFSRFSLGRKGAVTLFRTDGRVLMRKPFDEAQIGLDLSETANIQRLKAAYSGTFTGVSVLDDVRRIYSFSHIGKLPLMLSVALSEDEIYAGWRSRAAVIGLVLLALCCAMCCLGLLFKRELHRRALAEARTRTSELQYRLLADNSTDVIVRLTPDIVRSYVSPASLTVFGYTPEELIGRSPGESVHPDDWLRAAPEIEAAWRNRDRCDIIYRVRHKAGHYVWAEGRYSYLPEDGGFIVVLRDISERKLAEQQLEAANAELIHLASTDGLTGLANRRRFDEAIEQEWRRAARDAVPLSLLMLDVDRFKLFNDRYGHQEGDACLRVVAQAVAGCAERPADLVARYGGEELVLLLPATDEVGAAIMAERVRAAIAASGLEHAGNAEHGGVVTASIGVATVTPSTPRSGTQCPVLSAAALIVIADRALYEAKRNGRNCVAKANTDPLIFPPEQASAGEEKPAVAPASLQAAA